MRSGGSAVAILGSAELTGRWRPDGSTSAVAVLGESKVDLQGVEFEGAELVISAVSALGTVEIIVPEASKSTCVASPCSVSATIARTAR